MLADTEHLPPGKVTVIGLLESISPRRPTSYAILVHTLKHRISPPKPEYEISREHRQVTLAFSEQDLTELE